MTPTITRQTDALQSRIAVLEEELRLANTEAEASHRAKSDFLANMSHEIRTPLNAVLGFSRLLFKEQLTATQHEKVRYIYDSSRALLELVDDILTLAKADTGQLKPYPVCFDLPELVRDSLDHVSAEAYSKELRVECELDPRIPGILFGDRCRVRQALVALLDNAVKFTNQGQVTLCVSKKSETDDQLSVRFEVKDTGQGIPPEDLSLLFEPFTQGNSSATRSHGGIGLGLPLCRRIVELLDGQMGAESEPGWGSKFWFTLLLDKHPNEDNPPARVGARPALPPRSSALDSDEADTSIQPGENVTPSHGGKDLQARFLIVDDDRLCRVLLDDMLCHHGICEHAENGHQAVAMVADALNMAAPYDLVCLDIMMPGIDGHTVLASIRELEAKHGLTGLAGTKVVMTTALRESQHCIRAFRRGCEAYITKPVDETELLDALSELRIFKRTSAL